MGAGRVPRVSLGMVHLSQIIVDLQPPHAFLLPKILALTFQKYTAAQLLSNNGSHAP